MLQTTRNWLWIISPMTATLSERVRGEPLRKITDKPSPDPNLLNLRPEKTYPSGWMRYWAMLPLVLAYPLGAEAATTVDNNWVGLDTKSPPKAEVINTPKPLPSDLYLLPWETSETVQFQLLTLETAPNPEAAVQTTEATAAEGSEFTLDTAEAALSTTLAIPELGEDLPSLVAQTPDVTGEVPWRFSFEPYVYVPFGVNGDVTVGGVEVPINAGIGDIFDVAINTLNFAAFGRVEAWKGPWGIVFDGAYANLGTAQTVEIPLPSELQLFGLPSEIDIDAAVGVSFSRFDLAAAYRFGDGNLPNALRTADTEFDLGPFLFDAIAGLRLQTFTNELVLTSNLGDEFDFSDSQTFLEPMLGGHARWNMSDNLAVLTGASISGFGIGDLTLSVDGYAGIDWLFSGNTSLLASYRFTYVDSSSDSLGLNLFTHGPLIGVKFRF
jgi:hypothetical protein